MHYFVATSTRTFALSAACSLDTGHDRPVTELNDRARDVFRIVVESYLESGAPVGSRTISKAVAAESVSRRRSAMSCRTWRKPDCSPHRIRQRGGCRPKAALRLFVDAMMQVAEPSAEERAVIAGRLSADGPVEDALAAATLALVRAFGVRGSRARADARRRGCGRFAFVPLSSVQALVVLVGDDGSVENRVIDLPRGMTASALAEAGNFMTGRLSGNDAWRSSVGAGK